MKLTRAQVQAMVEAVCVEAERRGLRVSVAVADDAGHLAGFLRMEGALLASLEVCQVKAKTAVYFGTATKNLPATQPIAGPIADSVSFPVCLLPGGVPVVANGGMAGAVGVGGGSGEDDHACAMAGLAAIGAA